uniref:Uncharacterized protein n=1 Tax=Meloidogyne javanica TaxID=6303 RepID=A0A915M6R8_MELJA
MTEINLKDSQQQQECLAFEPQNYLKDRCKKCFRLKDKHESNLPIRKPTLERKTSSSSSTSKSASDAANVKTTKLAKTKSSNATNLNNFASASKNNSAKNSATASNNNFVSASKTNSASASQNNSNSVSNNSASVSNNFAAASTNSVSNSLSTKKHSPPTTNKSSPKKVLATNIANNKNNIPVPTNVATTFRRIPIQRSSSVKQKPIVTKQKEENNKQQKELKEASNEVEINEVLHTKSDENNELEEANNNLLQNENINEAEVKSEANNNEAILNKIGNNLTIVVEENGINKERNREDEVDEILSLCSYKTANSRLANSSSPSNFPVSANNVNGNGSNGHSQSEMFSAQSIDSLNSISFADSYKTSLRSPPPFFDNDDDFLTPTSTMDGHFFNQNIYNNFINQVQDENEEFGGVDSRARTPTAKDQCRMEEIEEFRELQRELDLNAKNCRILQFKLRKSERQREQLQAESEEEKSEEISEEQKFAQMEQELHVAKQISIKLQNELEAAEERRCRLEDELFYNREKVRELLAQNKWREAKNNREQQQNIRPRGEALIISSAALMVDGSSHVSARPEHFEEEEEPKEIQREVRDSMEREADLREQLRFTEADLQRTRKRMRELETENDDLLQKYTRLADQQAQNLSMLPGGLLTPKRPSLFRSIRQVAQNYNFEGNDSKMLTKGIISGNNRLNQGEQSSPKKSQRSASHCDTKEASEIIKGVGKEDNTIVDTEQLCYMLAAMDAQANRICKQLEKIEGSGNKEERRRSLKGGEIASVLEELARLLSEMKAIKEQLAHSQNISLTKSMILGNVLGDNNTNDCGKSKQECEDGSKPVGNNVCTAEEEANTQKVLAEKEITSLRNALDKQITETQSARDLLENTRAENVTLRKAMAEREAELSQAKEKAGGLEKGLDQSRIWETRCKEAKAERIRLQAELTQLRMRTDEALQELEKMRATHQQKEIVWIREKLKLEDLLKQTKQQPQQLSSPKTSIEKIIPVVVQMSKPSVNMCCSPSKQLEKQTDTVENNNVKQECVKVDYKQIADNALRAAESLQRQYREYQSHYTAEVERLNARLNNLEREQHQKRLEKSEEKKLNQAFPTFGLQSPSMSSLTENTTWDSRLLDCSMARSVSPFKFPRGACTTPTSVKACRMDNILFRSQGAEKIISGEFGSDEDSTSAMAAANAAASTNKAHREYRRTSSSVRQMAKAFDSFEQTRLNEKEAAAEESRRRKE